MALLDGYPGRREQRIECDNSNCAVCQYYKRQRKQV